MFCFTTISPAFEIFLLVYALGGILGVISTAKSLFNKKFQDQATFLRHLKLWFNVVVLQFGGLVLFREMGEDLAFSPMAILWLPLIAFFIVMSASCQYHLMHQNDLGLFDSFALAAIALLIFYSIFFKFPFLENKNQPPYIPTAEEIKLKAEQEKIMEIDKAMFDAIKPGASAGKN